MYIYKYVYICLAAATSQQCARVKKNISVTSPYIMLYNGNQLDIYVNITICNEYNHDKPIYGNGDFPIYS